MSGWLEEFWIVLCHSSRTQLAIASGLFFFVGILLMGQVFVGSLELHGPLAALTGVVREKLMHRYDKAAWAALASFGLLAVKTYRKDRRHLLGA
ncbi:hypothetical protein [Aquabacterium sp.]|uniref:hypothetical protein n=1 Tax=Aquabacterium sp. TaxID=1872578 RepID=UPI0035AFE312